jgi:subtilase family serine protease
MNVFSRMVFRRIAVLAVFALPACSAGVSSTQVPTASAGVSTTVSGTQRTVQGSRALAASCAAVTAGDGTCTNIELASSTIYGPTTPAQQVPGLHPADLQAAYHLPSALAGSGQTIAIVITNSDPNAESDLAVYRSTFGLPPCSSASGCFRVIASKDASVDVDWAREASVDLDMASAVCPNCKLMLYQAKDAKAGNLATAVSAAVAAGATVVSNSYAVAEVSSENNAMWAHPGVPIVAAAGDQGFGGVKWPAASTNVIAVGATTLVRNSTTARGWTETAWSGTGSGCSAIAAKPAWQTDSGCTMRMVADVAAVGDPATPVAVYDSYQDNGWVEMGGTSVATPIVAGAYALAGNAAQLSLNGASSLYANPGALNAISAGSNGTCTPLYLCTAGDGYSGPVGVGSPNGIAAF